MLKLMPAAPDHDRNANDVRRRALERLYLRRAAVDELIESLENYMRTQRATSAACIPFRELSEARRCS